MLLFSQGLRAAEGTPQPRVDAVMGPDGIQRVEITGGSYFFKPNHIALKINVPTELKITKEPGMAPHNVSMNSPEAGMTFTEELGAAPSIIRFTPTKEGNYPFFCTKKIPLLASHRDKGMEGVIEVVP